MSIAFGTKLRWKDIASQSFFCPGCGSERVYVHRQSRNWLFVLIPVAPKDVVDDYFECQTCHRQYDEHVITSPPTSDLATRMQRLTRAAAALAILDGDPYNEPTRARALNVIRGAGMPHYNETDLDADLRSIDVTRIDEEAKQLTVDLDLAGREHLMTEIGHVATATGEFSKENRSMIDRLGRSLQVPPGVVHQVLARLDQEAGQISAFGGPTKATSNTPPASAPPPPGD